MNKTPAGFTLLEMLIVLMLLAGITIMTGQAINKAVRTKGKIQAEIEQTSVMRDVLRIMERDINMSFHYRNVHYEMLKKIKDESSGQATTPNPNIQNPLLPPPPPPPNPPPTSTNPLVELKEPPKNYTQFLGESDSLYFTSLSHVRTLHDSQESDQCEIGYFLKNCRTRGPEKESKTSSCLWRKESVFIDDDLQKGGIEIPLLENIEKFELLYFGEEKEGWQKTWRTDEKGSEDIRNRFPQAVQIKLTVKDKDANSKKKYSMVMVAALRFPNNTPLDQGTQKKDTGPNEKAALPTGN